MCQGQYAPPITVVSSLKVGVQVPSPRPTIAVHHALHNRHNDLCTMDYGLITQEQTCRRHHAFFLGGRELAMICLADVKGLALTKKMLGSVSRFFIFLPCVPSPYQRTFSGQGQNKAHKRK